MAHVKIFTTGGSIDKIYTIDSVLVTGEPAVYEIMYQANVSIGYEIETILKKDSLDITDEERQMLVDRVRDDAATRIVITHGTDTMIQTAQLLTSITDKVIVLTGSMQPAAFKHTDAIFNVGGAVMAAQTLPNGVYIAMNGTVFDPFCVRKNREVYRFEEI